MVPYACSGLAQQYFVVPFHSRYVHSIIFFLMVKYSLATTFKLFNDLFSSPTAIQALRVVSVIAVHSLFFTHFITPKPHSNLQLSPSEVWPTWLVSCTQVLV